MWHRKLATTVFGSRKNYIDNVDMVLGLPIAMSRCSYSGFDFITIDPLRFILYPFFPARPIWGLGSYRYNVNGGTTNYVGRKGSITVGLPFSRRRSSRVLLLRQNTQGLMKKIPVIFLCWDDSSLLNLMRKRHGILGRSFCLPVKRDD